MAVGENWSVQEVRATIIDYMAMLKLELAGQSYNKTVHRLALVERLEGRSEGAVEMKHQNISAVLRDLGHFWIPGYKPRSNYQGILADEVTAWVESNPEIDRYALAAAEAPAATPEHFDFGLFEVSSPVLREGREAGLREPRASYEAHSRIGVKRDYAAREAHNSSLGRAGEEFVVKFEQYRLAREGLEGLAAKVEHVSKTQGDGLGFDVLSFAADGSEKFIEVKTTTFAKETPFFASANELRFAQKTRTTFRSIGSLNFGRRRNATNFPELFRITASWTLSVTGVRFCDELSGM